MNSDSDGVSGGGQSQGDGDARDDGDSRDQSQGDRSGAARDSEAGSDRSADRQQRREPAAVGAGAKAGSARAAARAASAKSGATSGKGRPTPPRNRNQRQRRNIFMRIVNYLREVVSELRKVIWPTKNEMTTYSIVVVLFLIFMITATWGADIGFAKLILFIFG